MVFRRSIFYIKNCGKIYKKDFLHITTSGKNPINLIPMDLKFPIIPMLMRVNFQWVFGMQIIGGGGRESTKLLEMLNLPWKGFKKHFPNIEAEAGVAEKLVRDLTIEQALQEEIKDTLEHNNQSYGDWCAL